jgi:DNA repair exonuclease SbcCD ATPase subunit
MRFITFKSLQGKNFLSFGDNLVHVDLRPGVNAIIGTNLDKEDSKNGAGKSSVTELLYYSLYGTTLREISKDHIQNSLTKKRCETSLTFDVTSNNVTDTYSVIRALNPTKCTLLKNEVDITRSTLAKTNALIQEIIHTPATVFQNSVIMSANTALPFMALPKTDKRKFIESVLGLEVFTEMVLRARDDYSSVKKDYESKYTLFERAQSELEFNQSQFDNYENLKQERIVKLEEKQHKLIKDIEIIGYNIVVPDYKLDYLKDRQESLEDQYPELKKKENQVKTKLNQLKSDIAFETKQLKQLQSTKDKCPTCNRDYSEEHVEHASKAIEEHANSITKLTEQESQYAAALQKIEDKYTDVKTQLDVILTKRLAVEEDLRNNKSYQISIDHLEKNLKEVEEDILVVKAEQNNELKGKISTLKTFVENSKTEVDKLNNELNVLETVKFVISEEGIKSFIVKKILTVLNSRIAYYLKKLEANCLCQFNEFFDEEIIDENSQPKSYFNFSGGERKRIDLACLFAFADIRRLQGDVNFSTVFYDELLDSSLDDKGVSLTLKVLRERFTENGESCYIITHRGPEVTTKAEHTIHITKRNGISQVSC